MSDVQERKIGGLTVRIEQETCIGSGNCTKVAPQVFEINDANVVQFKPAVESIDQSTLVEACNVCPVAALFAIDAKGRQLAP